MIGSLTWIKGNRPITPPHLDYKSPWEVTHCIENTSRSPLPPIFTNRNKALTSITAMGSQFTFGYDCVGIGIYGWLEVHGLAGCYSSRQ